MQEDDNNAKIEDSLDNLSNMKLRQSSLQKHRIQLIQVKQKFVSFLQKLQSSQTRQVSLSQLKKLIEQNNESDHLKIYLSILKTLKPNSNSTTKQHEILVISIVTQVYKTNLIDPMDKQPSLLKTVFRVVEILLGFFNDNSSTVQQACARVLLDLNEFCLEEQKYQKQQKMSILFTPLISILKNGVDKASQSTATVCINQLVKYWFSRQQKQYLDLVAKEMFQILLKLNSQYHDIFMTIIILIQHKGIAFFQNKLPNFISKISPIINGTRDGANNFNAYMCRVNVCKIMEKIALLLSAQQRDRLVDLNVMGSLQKAARNKIIQVQMAAARALKAWKGEPMPEQKIQRNSNSRGKHPLRSLQQLRDQKKRERSNSKQNTIKIQNQLNYMKEDLQKMVKGGWGANNRAKQYVKRGTGAGGGHYGQVQFSTPPKNNKSHREHLEELRQIIKKGSKQNKNLDKFDNFQGMKNYSNDIPTSSNNNINVFVQKNQIYQKPPKNQQVSEMNNNRNKNLKVKQKVLNDVEDEQDQFAVSENAGQQAVNFKPKPKASKPNLQNKSSNEDYSIATRKQSASIEQQQQAQNLVIQAQEAQQLLEQYQKGVANQKNSGQMKVNKLGNKKVFQSIQTPQQAHQQVIKDEKFIQRASKIKQNLDQIAPMISQQQLQQLMMENNLSDVSENVQNCLNQSDLHFQESKNNHVQYQQADNEQNQNAKIIQKGTQSMKKGNKFQDSLNFTDSRVTNLKQSLREKQKQNIPSNKVKGGEPLRQQFTLNPNSNQTVNRFQSIPNREMNIQDEEIEQDIVQSYFEESRPREQNMLPLKTNIAIKNNNSPTSKFQSSKNSKKSNIVRQQQQLEELQQTGQTYQQLIANPPASYQTKQYSDKKSALYQKQQSKIQEQENESSQMQQQQQEQQAITDKWIRILTLIENNSINEAFEEVFYLDDPIYLIRLMIITKMPLNELTADNCSKLWQKFLEIYQHNFISILFVQLFTQANELGLVKNSLTIEQMHELLIKLYQVSGTSKGKLSFNAAQLYNSIDQGIRPKKQ